MGGELGHPHLDVWRHSTHAGSRTRQRAHCSDPRSIRERDPGHVQTAIRLGSVSRGSAASLSKKLQLCRSRFLGPRFVVVLGSTGMATASIIYAATDGRELGSIGAIGLMASSAAMIRPSGVAAAHRHTRPVARHAVVTVAATMTSFGAILAFVLSRFVSGDREVAAAAACEVGG